MENIKVLRLIFNSVVESVLLSGGDGWGYIVCSEPRIISMCFEMYLSLNKPEMKWTSFGDSQSTVHYLFGEQEGVTITNKKVKKKDSLEIVVYLGSVFNVF